MGTTPSYGWVFPDPTDLVKDLPADFELFADAVDADLADLLGGAAGAVLKKNSASDHDFVWTTDTGFTQLATGTLSTAAVNITGIPTGYRHLDLLVRNYRPATDNVFMRLRFQNDANTRYKTLITSTFGLNKTFDETSLTASEQNDNTATESLSYIRVYDYANTTTWKMMEVFTLGVNATTTTNFNANRFFGFYNQTGAIDQINLLNDGGGNFNAGTYFLYGVR